MKYTSTRGNGGKFSFEEALLSGYAKDGGILIPEHIPKINSNTLKAWAGVSYPVLVKNICRLFIPVDEISDSDLFRLIDAAFASFIHPNVVELKVLKNGLHVLELFHGKTLAFKDLALSCIGQLMEHFLSRRKQHMTIVVGTSGDTGSAAIEAVRSLKWVDLIVLLPKGRCERIQELQMTTVIEPNIHVFRVDGTSDGIDLVIKPCFVDADFASQHNLCSINSINWARILVQIAHFFYAYLQICPECDQEVEIAVPTGACGNVTGGCYAVAMGLPIKLICATNANDIVYRTLKNQDFSVNDSVLQTLAPAMDIQLPYNLERIFHIFSQDSSLVRSLLEEFEKNGRVNVPEDMHHKISEVISGWRVDDHVIKETMLRCWQENEYLLCPHTATAVSYHYSHYSSGENSRRVCIATASPAKFEKAVTAAGLTPQYPESIKALFNADTKYTEMELGQDWNKMLREAIEEVSARCSIML